MHWGEAQTDPAMATIARTEVARFRAAAQRPGPSGRPTLVASGTATSADLGTVLVSLLPGYLLQRRILGDIAASSFAATVAALLDAAAGSPGAPSGAAGPLE